MTTWGSTGGHWVSMLHFYLVVCLWEPLHAIFFLDPALGLAMSWVRRPRCNSLH